MEESKPKTEAPEVVPQSKNAVILWLLSGCLLVFTMVVIGGITRLTNSGLSMVEWNLVMGSIPPLNEVQWEETFQKYQQSPEYKYKNFDFTRQEFKTIFWWEYIHRLLGRLIGIVFILPFTVFLLRKRFSSSMIKKLVILLFLGGMQGVIGWWMVKSGLVNDPDVSHYRLAVHLVNAFLVFAYTLWLILDIRHPREGRPDARLSGMRTLAFVILALLTLQIVFGAFTAGLNAGFTYNTWPKMGDSWMADSVGFALKKDGILSLVENIASVQFIHRSIAIILVILIGLLVFQGLKMNLNSGQRNSLYLLGGAVISQFTLGIFTLLMKVPISLGVLHQAGAVLLLCSVIYVIHQLLMSANGRS